MRSLFITFVVLVITACSGQTDMQRDSSDSVIEDTVADIMQSDDSADASVQDILDIVPGDILDDELVALPDLVDIEVSETIQDAEVAEDVCTPNPPKEERCGTICTNEHRLVQWDKEPFQANCQSCFDYAPCPEDGTVLVEKPSPTETRFRPDPSLVESLNSLTQGSKIGDKPDQDPAYAFQVEDKGVIVSLYSTAWKGGRPYWIPIDAETENLLFEEQISLIDRGYWGCPGASDLDGDGELEVICFGEGVGALSFKTDGSVVNTTLYTPPAGAPFSSRTVNTVDLNGDGAPEILISLRKSANVVLCNVGPMQYENCSADVGVSAYQGITFFMQPVLCHPGKSDQVCLFEGNDGYNSTNFFYRVVRDESKYGFHLEDFNPTTPKGGPPEQVNVCDTGTLSMALDMFHDAIDGHVECEEELIEAYQSYVAGGSNARKGYFSGTGITTPMGIACFVSPGGDQWQACCHLTQDPTLGPNTTHCIQPSGGWQTVTNLGLTQVPTQNGHLPKGWGPMALSLGARIGLLVVSGEDGPQAPVSSAPYATWMSGYQEHQKPGLSTYSLYEQSQNGTFDQRAAELGLVGWGEMITVSELYLGGVKYLVTGLMAGGFLAHELYRPEGNHIRLRLHGDDGADYNGALSRVVITPDGGDEATVLFAGMQSGQVYMGNRVGITAGAGDSTTVTVTVHWGGNRDVAPRVYKGIPADGVEHVLAQSKGIKEAP